MRATYQLNQEKLDYNYRVLVERDSENTNTIKQQKKKLTRMADILSNLKARYAREEKRFKTENTDLTEEYKRITEQFKDLQNKFQHFEVADTNRYRDVWQMNEEGITELMRKVLQGIVHAYLPRVSRVYLPHISPTSPLHLAYISPISRLHLARCSRRTRSCTSSS